MKAFARFLRTHQFTLLILFLTLCFIVFLYTPLILTFFRQPDKTINMMVGHYFEDYYEYLSYVKQGQLGRLLLNNLYSHDDNSLYFTPWWPYLLIGLPSFILRMEVLPQILYWMAAVFLILSYLLLTSASISLLLPEEKNGVKIATYLLILFSTSFFKISFAKELTIIPIDFWYAIGNPFSRYNIGTPHHQAANLIFLLGILSLIKDFAKKGKTALGKFILFSLLLFSLSPPQLFLFWGAYFFSFLTFIYWKNKDLSFKKNFLPQLTNKLIPFFLVLILFIPLIFFLKNYSHSVPAYLVSKQWDIASLVFPNYFYFTLTTGLLLPLAILGIPFYFRKMSFPKLLFFYLTLLSFTIITTPIFIGGKNIFEILGFFNLRFNTPTAYIFLGVAAMKLLRGIFRPILLVYLASFLIFLFYLPPLVTIWLYNLPGPYSARYLQYLPQELYQGMEYLKRNKNGPVVLTSPPSSLGIAVPALTGKKVYFGRPSFTLNFDKKREIANKFYDLSMTIEEGRQFLEREKIDYILVYETDINPIEKYYNLKMLFKNKSITVLSPS